MRRTRPFRVPPGGRHRVFLGHGGVVLGDDLHRLELENLMTADDADDFAVGGFAAELTEILSRLGKRERLHTPR